MRDIFFLFMGRRSFLRALLIGMGYCFVRPSLAKSEPLLDLVFEFSRHRSIRLLGLHYDHARDDRETLEALLDQISKSLGEIGVDASDPRELPEGLKQLISNDFAEGRTAYADYWLLSNTEMKICRAASLYDQRSAGISVEAHIRNQQENALSEFHQPNL